MLYYGIDPGVTGGLALVHEDKRLLTVISMPIDRVGGKNLLNIHDVGSWIAKCGQIYQGDAAVGIEQQSARPVEGRGSIARHHRAWGLLEGYCRGLGFPVIELRPVDWQRALKMTPQKKTADRKQASRRRVQDLYPDQSDYFQRVKDDGRAEAVLIALAARLEHLK